jgi:GNAT superfamily N-acetyltransferase
LHHEANPERGDSIPNDSDRRPENIKRLSDLINQVYDDAESGLWKRKGARTNPAEVERLLRDRAVILAEIDGAIVGSVNINLMGDGIGELGMLVADLNCRGKGIGSALVDRAEQSARDMGWRTMRPELLTPHVDSPEHRVPEAVVFQDWVPAADNRGFRATASGFGTAVGPECDFTGWLKPLG